jgi:hypothetical protein
VERRKELRYQPNQEIRLTVLGDDSHRVPARIINFSGRGISLAVEQPVRTGDAIRLDMEDSLLLGEVAYCQAQDGKFAIGVHLHEVIPSLSALANLVANVMSDGRGARPAAATASIRSNDNVASR